MSCDAFALYRLQEYEVQGSQGTWFTFTSYAKTEKELMDPLMEDTCVDSTYVIIPITLHGNGKLFTRTYQTQKWDNYTRTFKKYNMDVTSRFYNYKGDCKVLLENNCKDDDDSDSDDSYNSCENTNKPFWIPLKSVEAGIEDTSAVGYATIKKPKGWRNYEADKTEMEIAWDK